METDNKEQPKNSNTPVIVVFAILLILLVGLGAYVIVTLPKQLEAEIKEMADRAAESDIQKESKGATEENPDENSGEKSEGAILEKDWKEQFTNHSPEEFTGPYYESTVDCIDESVSYKVNREFFEYEDEDNNVCIHISYVQLEGEIPNLENINDELKTNALWYATYYEENTDTVLDYIKDTEDGYEVNSMAYVTYNDEDQISIVLNEKLVYGYYAEPALLATNINVKTGTILDNSKILDLDEDFGKEFRKRSEKQNGESESMDLFNDDEILNMLRDENSLILFYTPVGLELGYSYSEKNYTGWITISMQDYKKYLAGM